jgi:predicted DNA-binding protein
MSRNFSFRFPDELATKVDAEAARRALPYAEVIRQAVEEYFQRAPQQNVEAVLFEVVKTRAVMLRCFDMLGKELSAELLEESAKDAVSYLEERQVPDKGTKKAA